MEMLTGPSKEDYRFPKKERLKGRDEIRAVLNRRQGVSCEGARLFVLKNGFSYNRIAFAFARKFGSAVERNCSRRVSREAYRHLRGLIKPGHDLVLLVYPENSLPEAEPSTFSSRRNQLFELFNRAKLLENRSPADARSAAKASAKPQSRK